MGVLHFLHHWLKMTTNNERQSRWIPAYAGMTSKIVSGFALVLSTVSPSSGKTDRGGVVEKPGTGSERVPLVLHGHRIDLTLSSRRRRCIEGRSRCAPALPRYGARARLLGMRGSVVAGQTRVMRTSVCRPEREGLPLRVYGSHSRPIENATSIHGFHPAAFAVECPRYGQTFLSSADYALVL